jgi:hypothetical protein
MAALSDESLLSLMANRDLASAMSRRFGLNNNDDIRATEAACARLHNTGAWNFLAVVEGGALNALAGPQFFLAADTFNRILPELDAEPSRVMSCVESLVARGGDDGAANRPNAALRDWFEKDLVRAWQTIEAAHGGDALAGRNLTFALEALKAPGEARRFLVAHEDRRRLSAITALGRIADNDAESRRATLASFASLIDEVDDISKGAILEATAFLLSQDAAPVGPLELDLVRRLTTNPNDHVIHVAAQSLWVHPGARKPEIVAPLLAAVRSVKPTNKATIAQLDHALRTLLEEGQAEAALTFVRDLFSDKSELKLTDLDGFLRALTDGPPDVLAQAVVDWLLSGNARLCEGLSRGLRNLEDDASVLNFENAVPALTAVEQLFVCRKAIGWFFLQPCTAASALVSVLRACDAATAIEVRRLLVDPLLVNYGGIREYLQTLLPSDPAKPLVDAALAENEAYLSALRGVPKIKELNPSEVQRRVQRLRMVDQAREVGKAAREQSVLLHLVKSSVVLYGRRSLNFVQHPDGELKSVEIDLHPHEVSLERPRMEIVDPVGLDYTWRVLRFERFAR